MDPSHVHMWDNHLPSLALFRKKKMRDPLVSDNVSVIDSPCVGLIPNEGPTVRELSICIEFLNLALRALADGHTSDASFVRDPLLFGFAKVRDLTQEYFSARPGRASA